jgi:pyruvate,water dikinase
LETALRRIDASHYAVRSSATLEDGAQASFAGQLDSFLYVPPEQIAARIRDCWASLYGARCLAYASARGIDLARARVAVVVQEMVESVAAGVVFTADPNGASLDATIVAAVGLGAGAVADLVHTDTYVYRRATATWDLHVQGKPQQVVRAPGGGTRLAPVPDPTAPALPAAQRAALLRLADKVAAAFGRPQDIEWAMDAAGHLHLTQSRPITTGAARLSVFDDSNIVESYPDVTLPLTFSHAQRAYERLFRGALARLGVPAATLDAHREVFACLLGSIEGRVYYNLANWYRMFSLLPGARQYMPVWEKMLGIDDPLATTPKRASAFAWLCLCASGVRHFVTIGRELAALRRTLTAARAEARDLCGRSAHALIDLYLGLQDRLLPNWDLTLLNDGYAFLFSGLCRAWLRRCGVDEARFIESVAGGGALESIQPVEALRALAARVRQDDSLRRDLRANRPSPDFQRLLDAYLDAWGDRTTEELKLEAETLRERPDLLVQLILRYADTPQSTPPPQRPVVLPRRYQRIVYRLLLACARRSIRLRESSRFDRARAFGMIRNIFLALGAELPLRQPRDIFYLTQTEVFEHVWGTGPARNLQGLVAERHAALAHPEPLPHRFQTRGIVTGHPIVASEVAGAGDLRGTGCAPGRVTAPCRVLHKPDYAQDPRGQILVAPMTDPGWVFLMVSAAGLIVERGSLLSHTAIVGRELGIPTIVAVPGATHLLRDGDVITMDGQSGTIHRQP